MIFVSGVTGHIGNVLVRELLGGGERVRVLVPPGKKSLALAGLDVEMVPGDILNTESLDLALRGVRLVYHLAARISLTAGPDPEIGRVNLEGTRNIIAAVLRLGTARLVYVSSVYALEKAHRRQPHRRNATF